jgi:IS1 family transposase
MSCRLISESMNLVRIAIIFFVGGRLSAHFHLFFLLLKKKKVIVNETNARDTQEIMTKRLTAIKNQQSTGELEDLALIVGV